MYERGNCRLTKKQKLFCDEYLIDLNATQSAIRAGYSVASARQIADENLSKPDIKNYIEKALAERSKRTGINQDRVIQELARIAFVKITDVANDDGSINRDASDDDLACIESVKVESSSTDTGYSEKREVKLASKMKALELLGKHLGMWNDKLNVNLNLPVFMEGEDDLEE